MTNSPKKLKNIATHINSISDHETVSATYHPYGRKPTIVEMIIRNTKNITSDNMEKELSQNEKLRIMFEMEEPDDIANTMLEEFNNIIDKLSPPRVAQVKKNDNNNLSKEMKRLMEENKKQLTVAKETGKTEEYIKYRKNRMIIGQTVNEGKKKDSRITWIMKKIVGKH